MKKYLVIIPSWSKLSLEMQVETGCDYPVFIQLGGRPLYRHILQFYEGLRHQADYVIILPEKSPPLISSYLEGFAVRTMRIARSESIGDTVFQAMIGADENQSLIIHMADTLISPYVFDSTQNTLFVQLRQDLYRWTTVSKNTSGEICVLNDRDNISSVDKKLVFVGVVALSQSMSFKDHLENSLQNPNEEIDPFFSAIEKYSCHNNVELSTPKAWSDCGHIDSYYESRLNFYNLRHFNTLTYDSERGLVTKHSQNLEAFRHQVRWFKQVPDDLSSFLPRIYEISDGPQPYITMELMSFPTLSEIFVNSRLELGAWNDVARKIYKIQSLLSGYAFKSPIAKQIATEVYVSKTRRRITQFCSQRPESLKVWIDDDGRKFGLGVVLETLELFVSKTKLLDLETLTPIHGDMCFSNILYDPRGRHVKLIDPRGEFGIPGIYGDPCYDKAKLMHSYAGAYDFIVSDQFEVSLSESGKLSCQFNYSEYHHKVRQIFDAIVLVGEDRHKCEAIQALLFLSMLPLHNDKPERQLAMLYVGLTQYANNLKVGES